MNYWILKLFNLSDKEANKFVFTFLLICWFSITCNEMVLTFTHIIFSTYFKPHIKWNNKRLGAFLVPLGFILESYGITTSIGIALQKLETVIYTNYIHICNVTKYQQTSSHTLRLKLSWLHVSVHIFWECHVSPKNLSNLCPPGLYLFC